MELGVGPKDMRRWGWATPFQVVFDDEGGGEFFQCGVGTLGYEISGGVIISRGV